MVVFDQAEALDFVHARFLAHGRKTSDENVAALVAEVGLVPQQLDLAAAFLEKHILMSTADYVAALRAVKQNSSVEQQGQVVLPEANLGLRKVGH